VEAAVVFRLEQQGRAVTEEAVTGAQVVATMQANLEPQTRAVVAVRLPIKLVLQQVVLAARA
jgi:hypothetical protein